MIRVSPKPVACSNRTSSLISRLKMLVRNPPRSMGRDANNTRYATCGGAVWLDDDCIATVSLLTDTVQVYRWNRDRYRLRRIQHFPFHDDLDRPENLDFSPSLKVVAISNYGANRLSLFKIAEETGKLDAHPFLTLSIKHDLNTHGIGFSPSGRFLCYTTIGKPGVTGVFKLDKDEGGRITGTEVDVLHNALWPQVPKGVAVSPCEQFIAICFGPNAGAVLEDVKGTVAIYRFHQDGKIDRDPISAKSEELGLQCAEDIKFARDGSFISITDQVNNEVLFVPFDPPTGQLSDQISRLSNPTAELDFPHGVSFSPNGKYMATTNYGSDNVLIYALH